MARWVDLGFPVRELALPTPPILKAVTLSTMAESVWQIPQWVTRTSTCCGASSPGS
jgi:hypothetical protein